MGRGEMGLLCDGGLGICAVWVWVCFGAPGAVHATALAYAVVCRRRYLFSNQISSIANGAFAGLTALTSLYGAGLSMHVGWVVFACCLLFAWMRGAEGLISGCGSGLVARLHVALAHAVVCRRRYSNNIRISTIANGAFAGVTALTELYDAGLWARRTLILASWFLHGSSGLRGGLGLFSTAFFTLLSPFLACLIRTCSQTLHSWGHRSIPFLLFASVVWVCF
jgi:hypothetical protein